VQVAAANAAGCNQAPEAAKLGNGMATKQPNGVESGGRGGRRAGAGRPPGAKNKRTLALLDRVKKKGHELPRLLRRMNDKKLPEDYRDSLAA
jgi:hypothetical protein